MCAGMRHLGRRHFAAAFAAAVPGLVEIARRFDFLDAAPAPTNATPAWRILAADQRGARRGHRDRAGPDGQSIGRDGFPLARGRRLASESAALRMAGRSVVTFCPSSTLCQLMGRAPLATGRSAAITAMAFLEAGDGLADLPSRRQRASLSPSQHV
jgi:hypothetical protein